VARRLAYAGSNIILNGFGDAKSIEDTAKSISDEFKVKVHYSPADLRFEKDIHTMIADVEKFSEGGADILVNNAGIQYVAPVETFPVSTWNTVLEINLTAAFHTIRLSLPGMKKKNWGRIINIASVHGLVGYFLQVFHKIMNNLSSIVSFHRRSVEKSAYVASKHGLIGLTKVIALENGEKS
jgi:3-hydroxybutyrate dehydrogenase